MWIHPFKACRSWFTKVEMREEGTGRSYHESFSPWGSRSLTGMFLIHTFIYLPAPLQMFFLIGLQGLKAAALLSGSAQLSQASAPGQNHRVQPLQPLIKLLRRATAFIENIIFVLHIPRPSCYKGRKLDERHLPFSPWFHL